MLRSPTLLWRYVTKCRRHPGMPFSRLSPLPLSETRDGCRELAIPGLTDSTKLTPPTSKTPTTLDELPQQHADTCFFLFIHTSQPAFLNNGLRRYCMVNHQHEVPNDKDADNTVFFKGVRTDGTHQGAAEAAAEEAQADEYIGIAR